MNRFRRAMAVCMVAVLCAVSFTGCADKEENKAEAPERTPLKGSVTMTVADGEAYDIVGKLSGDIKVNKVDNLQEVFNDIKNGKCDFAVLNPIEAARYYANKGGIKVVTTLALGDWKIAVKDVPDDAEKEKDLSKLGGQIIHGIKDFEEPEYDPDEENSSQQGTIENNEASNMENINGDSAGLENGTTGNVNGPNESADLNGLEKPSDEPIDEPIALKEMSEEVFQTLMAKEGYGFYDGQIHWHKMGEMDNYINNFKAKVIGNEKNVEKAISGKENFKVVYSLAEMWEKDFGDVIPAYVLVATDKFLNERNNQVEGVLDAIADSLEENQKASQMKLVAYNLSNRGVMIVKDFIDILEENNKDAIDGKEINGGFYWSLK